MSMIASSRMYGIARRYFGWQLQVAYVDVGWYLFKPNISAQQDMFSHAT